MPALLTGSVEKNENHHLGQQNPLRVDLSNLPLDLQLQPEQ